MNQIRAWVRQGRTNAWIAHQLDITVDQVERFKAEHDLDSVEPTAAKAIDPLSIEIPEGPANWPEDEDDDAPDGDDSGDSDSSSSSRGGRGRGSRGGRGRSSRGGGSREGSREGGSRSGGSRSGGSRGGGSRSGGARDSSRDRSSRSSRGQRDDRQRPDRDRPAKDGGDDSSKRGRGRRGGRRRAKIPTYEATFDHGGEGYGLWLDPAIIDNPVYLKHWAKQRAIEVRLDPDSITIRRADVPGEPEQTD